MLLGYRKKPADVEALIKETAQKDGRHVQIYMEQEPGSAGLAVISHYSRNVLPGYSFEGIRSTGNKVDRAKPFSAAVNNDNVFLLMAEWNESFLEECAVFPQEGFHDDQVDAASGAFTHLMIQLLVLAM
jgi:predicted phage terminase large subunit-like protein